MESLGISMTPRQGAAIFLRDGQIIASAVQDRPLKASERFLPLSAVRHCLRQANHQSLDQVPVVGVQSCAPVDWADFFSSTWEESTGWLEMVKDLPGQVMDELHFRSELRKELNWLGSDTLDENSRVTYVDDERALVAGLFHRQRLSRLAILRLDNPSEESTTGLWRVEEGVIQEVWRSPFPASLDLLMRNLAAFCGLNGGLGLKQFLELAQYGEPRFVGDLREELVQWEAHGELTVAVSALERDPFQVTEFPELSRIFGEVGREASQPISSREIDLAHSFVSLLGEWAAELGIHLGRELELPDILIRGQGPLAELVRQRLERVPQLHQVEMVNDLEESLTLAMGAAIEALRERGKPAVWRGPLKVHSPVQVSAER